MKLSQTAGLTDAGVTRKLNEDHYLIDDDLGLLIVADGMGGHDQGEVASQLATQTIHQYFLSAQQDYCRYVDAVIGENTDNEKTWQDLPNPLLTIVENAIQAANNKINSINRDHGYNDNYGMGTTVVGIWLLEQLELAIIFHVGDSRLYLLRNNTLEQLTVDHSLHQLWLDNGQIGLEPPTNIILSGLGLRPTVDISTRLLSLAANDVFLLCSDGLSDLLEHDDLATLLKKIPQSSLASVGAELVEKANQAGGTDNITAALVLLSS